MMGYWTERVSFLRVHHGNLTGSDWGIGHRFHHRKGGAVVKGTALQLYVVDDVHCPILPQGLSQSTMPPSLLSTAQNIALLPGWSFSCGPR